MEKQAIINDENTPPEEIEETSPKQTQVPTLEDHLTKRAADAVQPGCCGGSCHTA